MLIFYIKFFKNDTSDKMNTNPFNRYFCLKFSRHIGGQSLRQPCLNRFGLNSNKKKSEQ